MLKNAPINAGDACLIPGPERSHMPQHNEACEPQLLNAHAATTED